MTSRTGTEVPTVRPREASPQSKGFTLTELLVVIAIMMMLAAAAVPAINAFRRGQRLDHATRLTQSALNDARRLAITRHARHVVVLYSYEDKPGEASSIRHAVRVYQEPTGVPPGGNVPPSVSRGHFPGGYVGKTLVLPLGTRFKRDRMSCVVHNSPTEDGPEISSTIFEKQQRGVRSEDVIAFRRDGTVEDRNDIAATDNGARANIYLADENFFQVPEIQRADIVIVETSPSGEEVRSSGRVRRALLDVSLNTGRSIGKVFEIGGSVPERLGAAAGGGASSSGGGGGM